jgi:hypothetical protein
MTKIIKQISLAASFAALLVDGGEIPANVLAD